MLVKAKKHKWRKLGERQVEKHPRESIVSFFYSQIFITRFIGLFAYQIIIFFSKVTQKIRESLAKAPRKLKCKFQENMA